MSSAKKLVSEDQAPVGPLTIVVVEVGWIHTMSGCTVVDWQSLWSMSCFQLVQETIPCLRDWHCIQHIVRNRKQRTLFGEEVKCAQDTREREQVQSRSGLGSSWHSACIDRSPPC
jgi:hypothetical protein